MHHPRRARPKPDAMQQPGAIAATAATPHSRQVSGEVALIEAQPERRVRRGGFERHGLTLSPLPRRINQDFCPTPPPLENMALSCGKNQGHK